MFTRLHFFRRVPVLKVARYGFYQIEIIRHVDFLLIYSYRKASIGFNLPAFSAGYKPASKPTSVQIATP